MQTALGEPSQVDEDWYDDYRDKYCIEQDFYDAVARARREANSTSGAPFSEQRIEYILKTGGNWAGPDQASSAWSSTRAIPTAW